MSLNIQAQLRNIFSYVKSYDANNRNALEDNALDFDISQKVDEKTATKLTTLTTSINATKSDGKNDGHKYTVAITSRRKKHDFKTQDDTKAITDKNVSSTATRIKAAVTHLKKLNDPIAIESITNVPTKDTKTLSTTCMHFPSSTIPTISQILPSSTVSQNGFTTSITSTMKEHFDFPTNISRTAIPGSGSVTGNGTIHASTYSSTSDQAPTKTFSILSSYNTHPNILPASATSMDLLRDTVSNTNTASNFAYATYATSLFPSDYGIPTMTTSSSTVSLNEPSSTHSTVTSATARTENQPSALTSTSATLGKSATSTTSLTEAILFNGHSTSSSISTDTGMLDITLNNVWPTTSFEPTIQAIDSMISSITMSPGTTDGVFDLLLPTASGSWSPTTTTRTKKTQKSTSVISSSSTSLKSTSKSTKSTRTKNTTKSTRKHTTTTRRTTTSRKTRTARRTKSTTTIKRTRKKTTRKHTTARGKGKGHSRDEEDTKHTTHKKKKPHHTSPTPTLTATETDVIMVTTTIEVATKTEVIVDGKTITVTTVIPTLGVIPSYTHSNGLINDGSNHTSSGTIAGAVMGASAGVAALIGGSYILGKKYRKGLLRRRQQAELDNADFYGDPYQQDIDWNNQFLPENNIPRHQPMEEVEGAHTVNPDSGLECPGAGLDDKSPTTNDYTWPRLDSFADEYDEYGHPQRGSFWSNLSNKLSKTFRH